MNGETIGKCPRCHKDITMGESTQTVDNYMTHKCDIRIVKQLAYLKQERR